MAIVQAGERPVQLASWALLLLLLLTVPLELTVRAPWWVEEWVGTSLPA